MAMPADALGFDTLSYARRLKDAGVDEKQAEAHAEAVRDAMTQGVATKADIAHLETRIAEMKFTILMAIVAVGGLVAAVGGLIFAAIKSLP